MSSIITLMSSSPSQRPPGTETSETFSILNQPSPKFNPNDVLRPRPTRSSSVIVSSSPSMNFGSGKENGTGEGKKG